MLLTAVVLGVFWFGFEFVALQASDEGPTLKTSLGEVEGYKATSKGGREYLSFAGLPFAKPPIGELRLEPPEKPEPWTGRRQARTHGPMCSQINIYFNGKATGSEDCLYLSVFTHKLEGKAPVMVHFHGGGWLLGDGPNTKGPEFLMDQDIVVVDINFRVGILGFLSFEDTALPGNMGLKDQAMALQWVKENIANFGGDADQVTLMGECAGGDAVYHHMVSPMSKGLFHRGVAESGSSYTTQAVAPPGYAKRNADKVAEMFSCKGNSKEKLDCLKKVDHLEITAKLLSFLEWQIDPVLSFSPVLEKDTLGSFLVGPMSEWKPANVPLLTGITSGEGLLRTMFFTHDFDFADFNKDSNSLLSMSLLLKETSSKPDEIVKKVRDYYLPGGAPISMENFKNLTDMYGDNWFSYGVLDGARKATGTVYMYFLDYVGDHTMTAFFGNRSLATGAFHTDEQLYLWEFPGVPPLKGKDLQLSLDLINLFTDFIKTGNPTPTADLGFKWTPYMPGDNYLAIRNTGFKMEKGLLTERYDFWKSLNFRDKLV